uniref:Uncharacterized protein n=2 Tax=Avena sativa TaxID=4498 RepID=A0ACD5UM23_AVESA
MKSSEAVLTRKSCNQDSRELTVCQMTEELNTWKLNERQQQLVDTSGLGNLIHTADLIVDHTVLRAFCELWSKETNTARFHDFEMAPSLRDTAHILGIPVIGRAVTTGDVLNMSSEQLFFQYLGQVPGRGYCRGSRVKLSWLLSKFSQLSEHPTAEEIVYSTRAYLLYLIGATLFLEKEWGYVSPKYLPLLSDFEKVREYAWGAAALAHLYKALSTVMSTTRKRLFGSAALLMGWIYEYIPAIRPDKDDVPADVFPRVCRWSRRTISQPATEVSDIRKAFSQLRVSDVNWEPYKDMDPASVPNMCVATDNVCSSRTWLISFNVREVYVPDRFARQFGQEQHQLNAVHVLQRHQWNASVDWSLEYASEIKHFEQLVNATRHDHTTVPATCDTTEGVFTEANTAREFHDLNLQTVVENIKEEFRTIMRFLDPQSFRSEVAMSFARISELLKASHLKEGNVDDVDARGGGTSEPELTAIQPPVMPPRELAATGTTDGPATAQAPEHVPDEGMQNGSDQPAPECCDTPREQEVGDVSGRPGEEEALERTLWIESSEEEEEDGHDQIHELLKASHMKEGDVAVDAQGGGTVRPELTAPHPHAIPVCQQAAAGTTNGPATVHGLEPVPVEAMQNSSDQPAPECCDTPREEEVGGASGTPGEEEALERSESSEEDEYEDERGHEGRKRPRRYVEGRGGLRRSNRRCVQAKRFRHRGGKGSLASVPVEL